MKQESGNLGPERAALKNAMAVVGRTPEADKLHQAATNLTDPSAVNDLRDLVHGNFARLTESGKDSLAGYMVDDALRALLERSGITVKKIISGGKSADELKAAMKQKKIKVYKYAESMLDNTDEQSGFKVSPQEEGVFITCAVDDLFKDGKIHTTAEISGKIKDLGLDKCRKDDGPNLRLETLDQPKNDVQWAFSDTITASADSGGNPEVFELVYGGEGLRLSSNWTGPDFRWNPGYRLILRLRKLPEA